MKKKISFWIVLLLLVPSLFLAGYAWSGSNTISLSERRTLAKLPALNTDNILSGKFQDGLESWMEDHIPGRDLLLKLQSFSRLYLFGDQDDNGLVSRDGSLISVQTEIDQESLDHAASVFDKIYSTCLEGTDCSIYFSIIPDKSYFLETGENLNMDYAAFFEQAWKTADFATPVSIESTLSLSDYYHSDPHWKQESLLETASTLASAMGVDIVQDYDLVNVLDDFKGQSAGTTALSYETDELNVLTNSSMDNWSVEIWNGSGYEESSLYDLEKANGMDPYSVFLEGNPGLIVINNPDADNDKELIIFRDSYGSSIAPLLATGYSKTTLVDLRQMPSFRIPSVIDFTDQDVLFLYSVTVLNASDALK